MNSNKKPLWLDEELDEAVQSLKQIVSSNMRPPEEVILCEPEVISMLRTSKRTIATLRAEGLLKYSKVRGLIFYRLKDIIDMINSHRVDVRIPDPRIFNTKSRHL